eukprot:276485-Amorphochlora_amoeboformis.AAC.1
MQTYNKRLDLRMEQPLSISTLTLRYRTSTDSSAPKFTPDKGIEAPPPVLPNIARTREGESERGVEKLERGSAAPPLEAVRRTINDWAQ